MLGEEQLVSAEPAIVLFSSDIITNDLVIERTLLSDSDALFPTFLKSPPNSSPSRCEDGDDELSDDECNNDNYTQCTIARQTEAKNALHEVRNELGFSKSNDEGKNPRVPTYMIRPDPKCVFSSIHDPSSVSPASSANPLEPHEILDSDSNDDYYDERFSEESSESSHDDDSATGCSSDDDCFTTFDTRKVNGDKIMFPAAGLTISDVLLMITTFSVQKRLTRRDQDDLIRLIKILAGPDFESWDVSHYYRSKIYNPPRRLMTAHYFCAGEKCASLLTSRSLQESMKKSETFQCEDCGMENTITQRSLNQFISVDVRYQLQLLFNDKKFQENLLETLDNLRSRNNDEKIEDVYDSQCYRTVQKKLPGCLTYNISTDGAPMFVATKRAMWALQLHLNELSPRLRFKNIILAGLFITSKEPNPYFMNLYLKTFVKQAKDLMEQGVTFTVHSTKQKMNLKLSCLLAPVDSVARPVMQNRLQFNGYFGCSWCYHPGEWIDNAMRYPLTTKDSPRTHLKYLEDVAAVMKTGKIINGVKGPCAFMELDHFDCVWSFPVDYMHTVLLGIARGLWTIWTTPGKNGYLNAAQRLQIEQRLLQIKRPHEIHRFPRSLKEKWKASEWKSWVLYDSVVCLDGILENRYFESYLLFVRSIATLLKSSIPEAEIQRCEMDFLQFVGDCQNFYGLSAMTFNLQVLLHCGESVRRNGPLWATATFVFEDTIFHLKQELNSPNGVSHQIIMQYIKRKFIQSNIDHNTTNPACRQYCHYLFQPPLLKYCVKTANNVSLIGSGKSNVKQRKLLADALNDVNVSVTAFNRCIYGDTRLRSLKYTRAGRTDDTVVQLKDKSILQIHDFLCANDQCYIHGRKIIVAPYECNQQIALHHLFRVTTYDDQDVIVNADEIERKVIHFSDGEKNFIAFFPNTYEIQ